MKRGVAFVINGAVIGIGREQTMNLNDVEKIRTENPVVVNYANFVTPFLVANGLNAVGASPIMSDEASEADELVKLASAVVINAGAARRDGWPVIEQLCQSANKYHKPLILDPVAVGATEYRRELNFGLLERHQFDIIRGNIGEIAVLAGIEWQTRGIDAGDGDRDASDIVRECARKFNNVVIASGKVDYISDGNRVTSILNNTRLLPAIVGSGDLLSSISAAFAAISDNNFDAAVTASLVLSCSGELVDQKLNHQNLPGSFLSQLMDQLANISPEEIKAIMKVEEN
ncbi:hydroxyethylthiazole kinase [Pediococcus stilesii]|uniref:Hydroxyethylthiazole kinase n=2 Tax=Pediococcus stilesii TaxID=331679 RepID=A0A0R2KYZ5_9LACO|nr:hydroxyethylthiazole kinase [Pediococcus stilesii]